VTSPSSHSAPTAPRERLGSLDLLRGFALCGILIINMRYFAMPFARGVLNDPNHPGGHFAPADFWSWLGANVLFEDKMMALFSLLFGAGIWLMRDRGLLLHYRRMFWLLLIGLTHAVLLWFGDILTLYALCGMVVVWLRRLPASLLIVLGLSGVLVTNLERPVTQLWAESTPVAAAATEAAGSVPPAEGAEAAPVEPAQAEQAGAAEAGPAEAGPAVEGPGKSTADGEATAGEAAAQVAAAAEPPATPPHDRAQPRGLRAWRAELRDGFNQALGESFDPETERDMHLGSWSGQVAWRARLVVWWQGGGFLLNGLLWNGGMMLIGMGLMSLGYLAGKMRAGVYLGLAFASLTLGLALSLVGVWPQALRPLGRLPELLDPGQGGSPAVFQRYARLAYLVRSLAVPMVCFGWLSLLLWLHRSRLLRLLLQPLRAVGRTALSNYLGHTAVCVIVFEGWALGRWDQLRYLEQFELVAWILGVQLVLSPLWLALFRFGPMEWLWRSLTYWRPQPLRRRGHGAGPPADAPPPAPPPHGFAGDMPLEHTAG